MYARKRKCILSSTYSFYFLFLSNVYILLINTNYMAPDNNNEDSERERPDEAEHISYKRACRVLNIRQTNSSLSLLK